MVRKDEYSTGSTKPTTKTEDTSEEETATSSKSKGQGGQSGRGGSGISKKAVLEEAVLIRDALSSVAKSSSSLIDADSDNYYEYTVRGMHMKVPLRDEVHSSQPLPVQNVVTFGDRFNYEGSKTGFVDPFYGMAPTVAQYGALSMDPTSEWTDEITWKDSFGGVIFKALINNIRANKHVTEAEMVKIVIALCAYAKMFRATMRFVSVYMINYTNICNVFKAAILSSSGGSALFSSKDEMIGDLVKNYKEHSIPWPLMAFWADRTGVTSIGYQYPWLKYLLMIPYLPTYDKYDLARIFDAYVTTSVCYHPETYLKNQGLWNKFRDNIMPLLWGKVSYDKYIGVDITRYLYEIGWKPITFDPQLKSFYLNGFWTHPLGGETSGVGERKLPKRGLDNTVYTLESYYWDTNGHGKPKIFPADSFMLENKNKPETIKRSPWLDPIEWLGSIITNYSANDAQVGMGGLSLGGPVSSAGVRSDMTWDEYFSIFPFYCLEMNKFESVEPEPDEDVHAAMTDTEMGENFIDMIKYLYLPDHVPCKLPDKHWYTGSRRLFLYGCAILNIKPDDYEIYSIQKERTEIGATGQQIGSGDTR